MFACVITTGLTDDMGSLHITAMRTFHESGEESFPVGTTMPLIRSTKTLLWNGHEKNLLLDERDTVR
jgi:hypothetical protein